MAEERKMKDNMTIGEPPRGWRRLVALGPGLVWAASSVGVAELVFATRAGAIFGFLLLWVPIVSLFFKYFFTEMMGRYTIATGEDVISAFARIETKIGPITLPKGWIIWIFWVFFIASVAGMGGIALTVGSAIFGVYSGVSYVVYAIISLMSVWIILFIGSYRGLENVSRILIAAMIFFVIYAVVKESPPASLVGSGLIPNIPDKSLRELIPLLGWTGAGAMGTIWFSLWTKASGRGVSEKPGKMTPAVQRKISGWIEISRIDLIFNMVLTGILTIGFLLAGASILHPLGLVPEGEGIGIILAGIAGKFYGRQGEIIFLVGVFSTLYSTLLADIDGLCRVASGAVESRWGKKRDKRFYYLIFLAVYVVSAGLFATIISAPVILLQLTAVIDTLLLPVVGLMGIYICTRFLPPVFRPGRWFVIFSYASVLFFVFFIVLLIIAVVRGVSFSI